MRPWPRRPRRLHYSGMATSPRNARHRLPERGPLLVDNIVNKKYYVTGGIGSGETRRDSAQLFLRNNAYCESCSTCGLIFFQYKNEPRLSHAKYADLYEESLYNALLGATDGRQTFFYDNPLWTASGAPGMPALLRRNIPRLAHASHWTYARATTAFASISYRTPSTWKSLRPRRQDRCANGSKNRLPLERQCFDHRQSKAIHELHHLCRVPTGHSALYTETPGQRPGFLASTPHNHAQIDKVTPSSTASGPPATD